MCEELECPLEYLEVEKEASEDGQRIGHCHLPGLHDVEMPFVGYPSFFFRFRMRIIDLEGCLLCNWAEGEEGACPS